MGFARRIVLLDKMFHEVFMESSRKGCRQGGVLVPGVNFRLRSKLFRTFFIPEKEKTMKFFLLIKRLELRAAFIIGHIALQFSVNSSFTKHFFAALQFIFLQDFCAKSNH